MSPEAAAPRLGRGAQLLTAALVVLAVGLAASVFVLSGHTPSLTHVVVLAAAIAGGEALRIDLAYRRGGNATFSLSDTSLAIGLLLVSGPEVVLAGVIAMVVWQLAEQVAPFKLAFNVAQYLAGFAAAALIMELLAPRPGPLSAQAFIAVALGLGAHLLVGTVAVGGMIALTTNSSWGAIVHRLMSTATLLVIGNLGLGVIAVLLMDTHMWALPALGIPLALLYRASRSEVRAQVDKERSQAYVGVEQRLGEATSPDEVAVLLAEGAEQILGCTAAVWRNEAWVTPVPAGSSPCPVDPELSTPLIAQGSGLGPAVSGTCAAIGLSGGVLVLWEGDLGVEADTKEWMEQLARSGRVHFARAVAATALLKEQATLRAVVDGTGDGIFVIDASGALRVWNPAMAALAGCAAHEALTAPVTEVLGDGPWGSDGVHDVVRPDDRVWRVSVDTITDEAHGSLHVAVVHDVSAERRVARMKDDMLAVVSHELRTPLTPIKASAQLLVRRWERMTDDRRNELLTQIEKRADHLTRLVSDLLLVGQLSASSRPDPQVSHAHTDVSGVLAEAVADLGIGHPGHHIELEAPEALHTITDPLRLRQIVDNLIENACKFSSEGTSVRVSLERQADTAILRVVDAGRGIPPEDLERVFERFERVEDPLLMTTSGAGLGLYIVKSLVHALDGTIALRSKVGQGTTVTVTLPLTSAELLGSTEQVMSA
jgi:signal transduction histidine kinase